MPTNQVPCRLIHRQREAAAATPGVCCPDPPLQESPTPRTWQGRRTRSCAGPEFTVIRTKAMAADQKARRRCGASQVAAPVDEEDVGGKSQPGDEIDPAQAHGLVAEPVRQFREPFPVDPALPDHGEGVGVGLDEVMGGKKEARVRQGATRYRGQQAGFVSSSKWREHHRQHNQNAPYSSGAENKGEPTAREFLRPCAPGATTGSAAVTSICNTVSGRLLDW